MTYDTTAAGLTAEAGAEPPADLTPQGRMAWLLDRFVAHTPGVTHALLASRDGIKLLYSEMTRDPADAMAAAVSGLSSLAANLTGPTGGKLAPRQIIIERDDCLFFVTSAGTSSAFTNHPGNTRGVVDTVLGVIARPDADVGNIGFEMDRLVQRFASHMVTAVRQDDGSR
ncbi:roadblock/LC7 domain-containing protein [Streptomyces echinoruber]|uniref:roadblock/LC7 domain-containing protein n=1 Tax=Streptomyces echinoruber TaxID=68898 RepID=UPI003605CA1A